MGDDLSHTAGAVTGYCTSALNSKASESVFFTDSDDTLKSGNTPVRQVRSALRHFRPKAGKNELYGFPVCLCARIEVCLCVCSVHACVCSCAMCITCLLRRNLSLAAVRSSWKFEREQAQCHQLEAKDHTEYSKVRLERSLACRGQLPLLSACPLQLSGWSN